MHTFILSIHNRSLVFFDWTKYERSRPLFWFSPRLNVCLECDIFFLPFLFWLGWTGNYTKPALLLSSTRMCIDPSPCSLSITLLFVLRCSCLGSRLLIVFLLDFHWLWLRLSQCSFLHSVLDRHARQPAIATLSPWRPLSPPPHLALQRSSKVLSLEDNLLCEYQKQMAVFFASVSRFGCKMKTIGVAILGRLWRVSKYHHDAVRRRWEKWGRLLDCFFLCWTWSLTTTWMEIRKGVPYLVVYALGFIGVCS